MTFDAFLLWVGIGVATAVAVFLLRWAAKSAFDDLKRLIGTPNGNGDLITMVERLLAHQHEMFAWQQKKDVADTATLAWQAEHDKLDADTREDVAAIKDHLGL